MDTSDKFDIRLSPEGHFIVPARFHAGLSLTEKEELIVTLRVVAERIIALPDVQSWWHDASTAPPPSVDDLRSWVDRNGALPYDLSPLRKQMTTDVYPRLRERCVSLRLTPKGPPPMLLAVLLVRYVQTAAVAQATEWETSEGRSPKSLPPLVVSWEPIAATDRRLLLRELFASLADRELAIADLPADEYCVAADDLVEKWSVVYANIAGRPFKGRRPVSEPEKRATVFCRHKIDGESQASLGLELAGNTENGADGRRTIQRWIDHIEELLSMA